MGCLMSTEAVTTSASKKAKTAKSVHVVAARDKPDGYPERNVSIVDWNTPDPNYKPVEYTADVVKKFDRTKTKNGWADPEDYSSIKDEVLSRTSYEGEMKTDSNGYPRNPKGRTGIIGRGLLGKWGPNFAADPIVTRINPETKKWQMVAVERSDNKQWAIPGGMVDPGESVSVTLKREFTEEAGNVAPEKREEFEKLIQELFSNGVEVYKGYVDDPRNTDNAWMETTAFHFHCNDKLVKELTLAAGSDATNVQWLDIDEKNSHFANLYASHKPMVLEAVANAKKRMAS